MTLILFDLDGTVTDSGLAIKNSFEHTCDLFGLPHPSGDEMRALIGPPLETSFGRLLPDAATATQAVQAYRERYGRFATDETFLYDGIVGALDALADEGHTMALATSKDEIAAHQVLAHFGLLDRFAAVAGALRDGSRHHKADVIGHALALLGHDGTGAVMVGDRDHDVLGARQHGIDTVGVLWGFGSLPELETAGARWIIERPEELPPTITGAR